MALPGWLTLNEIASDDSAVVQGVVFLQRHKKRVISNFDALREHVKSIVPAGVEVDAVSQGKMNFQEQVANMANAGVVIGMHGADLTNCIFLPQNAVLIEINPKHSPAHSNLGWLLKNHKQDYDGAEKHYRRAIEIDPENATAHNNLGGLLMDIDFVFCVLWTFTSLSRLGPRLVAKLLEGLVTTGGPGCSPLKGGSAARPRARVCDVNANRSRQRSLWNSVKACQKKLG